MRDLLGSVFVHIYCMEMPDVVGWGLVITIAFVAVYQHYRNRRWMNYLLGIALTCCIAIVLYAAIGNRSDDHVLQVSLIPFHSYREVWAGGNPEIYRSNFMNVALFYPAGVFLTCLLPKKWPGWCRCFLAVIPLSALSAGIEYLQYCYALGQVEIDDVIHNTAGALVGSLTALLIPLCLLWIKKMIDRKRKCKP